MHFDWRREGCDGTMIFVPLVTQEGAEYEEETRKGLILGLGWQPIQYKHPSTRGRWEETFKYLDFVGIVTRNEELTKGFFKKPNIFDEQLFSVGTRPLTRKLFPSRDGTRHRVPELRPVQSRCHRARQPQHSA
jgi:hypothetical protein